MSLPVSGKGGICGWQECGSPSEAPAHPAPPERRFWEAVSKVDSSCSLGFPSPRNLGMFAALSGVCWVGAVWVGQGLDSLELEHLG